MGYRTKTMEKKMKEKLVLEIEWDRPKDWKFMQDHKKLLLRRIRRCVSEWFFNNLEWKCRIKEKIR